MGRLLTLATAAALGLGALPASAQVYPERIPSLARARARAEQARDRQRGQEEQTERTTKTVRIGANGELDIANIAGDITVTRGSGNDATVEIVKTARGRTPDEAREMLGLVQVDVAERGGRAEIRTRYPSGDEMRVRNRRNLSVSVAFTIAAPPNARITARSVSGNLGVRDIRGELSLESVSGNITIANGGRVAQAKTVSGNVEITGTELEGALEASSVSGTVALRKSKARRLDLSTVSGNLDLEDVDCARVDMQAVSGDIQLAGRLASSGRYDINSHSGQIRVAVSGDTGFEVNAESFSGSIRSDFPLTQEGPADTGRGRHQRSLRGVYGNGSAVLDLTTFSGSILITKR